MPVTRLERPESANLAARAASSLADSDELWYLWISTGRLRTEYITDGSKSIVVVRDGTWWSWSESTGGQTNEGRESELRSLGPCEALLNPLEYVPHLQIESVVQGDLLGREVLSVLGKPKSSADGLVPTALKRISSGSPQLYQLTIDVEYGALLGVQAQVDRLVYRAVEMTEVAFDEAFSEKTFVIDLPDGENFAAPLLRHVELTELAGSVPFTIFLPVRQAVGRATVYLPDKARQTGLRVLVRYSIQFDGAHQPVMCSVVENANSDGWVESGTSARPWERRGPMLVREAGDNEEGPAEVRFERGNTSIQLSAYGASVRDLVTLAESMAELSRS